MTCEVNALKIDAERFRLMIIGAADDPAALNVVNFDIIRHCRIIAALFMLRSC